MLKKIRVDQLAVGMHLKSFCGSYLDHPFWRTGFVLTDPKDIEKVRASVIREVWIDASKGADVPPSESALSEVVSEELLAEVEKGEAAERRDLRPVSTADEVKRAALICSRSKQAVVSMFQEARMGKAIDMHGARQLVEEISDSVTRNPGALISLARLKTADDYTYMHSVAVCALMVALAKQLGLDDETTRSAGLAGLVHDLGKAMMPSPARLPRSPGR